MEASHSHLEGTKFILERQWHIYPVDSFPVHCPEKDHFCSFSFALLPLPHPYRKELSGLILTCAAETEADTTETKMSVLRKVKNEEHWKAESSGISAVCKKQVNG
jgi:hypothetical protein